MSSNNGSLKRGPEEEEAASSSENGKKLKTEEDTTTPSLSTLIVSGAVAWDLTGRKQPPTSYKAPPKQVSLTNLWGPHVWSNEDVHVKAIATSCVACHSAVITEEGRVFTWGRNESGQLGLGHCNTTYFPTLVEELDGLNIVQAAMGRSHTLFLTEEGVVYSTGKATSGQLGQGTNDTKDQLVPKKVDFGGKQIVQMACGAEFSMIVDVDGNLFSFGSPEYGQLGHNTDGKLLEKAGKISFDCERAPRIVSNFVEKSKQGSLQVNNVKIMDVKCGTNHTVALDTKGRVFTWGFAGYGRLGHAETKDEFCPRQVKQLENLRVTVTKIAAGSTFCLATATNKNLYFWGQTKPSGEATMYPKPLQDLSGWNVTALSCANKSIGVVADDCVITWGASPTYGELCYDYDGKLKSSTTPKECKPFEGLHVTDIAFGFGHALFIVKDLTKEQKAKLPKWPVLV